MEGEYQAAVNRMRAATLRALQATLDILAAESRLTPARALLDHWQAATAGQPKGQGPKERGGSALADRLRTSTFLRAGEMAGEQQWVKFRTLPGRIVVEEEEALRTASEWQDMRGTIRVMVKILNPGYGLRP